MQKVATTADRARIRAKLTAAAGKRNKKALAAFPLQGLSLYETRRYLLSHFWHYHRLGKLNYRVRDGNGCDLSDIVTGK